MLSRLASYLHRVQSRAALGQHLTARVVIVPAVNILGVNTRSRRWPFDGTDINRMFPGYDGGETTQRIADAVLRLTRAAHYRVDIHSSNLDFEELPQVRLYEPSDAERATAHSFGLPAVIERPMNSVVHQHDRPRLAQLPAARTSSSSAGAPGDLSRRTASACSAPWSSSSAASACCDGRSARHRGRGRHHFAVDQTLLR